MYQTEGLLKNLSIEEFLASKASKLERCVKYGVDYPTFDKWYRKTHKKVFPVNITGKPEEDAEIQVEASADDKETYKEDVKAQQRLLKAIDDMTRRQADKDAENNVQRRTDYERSALPLATNGTHDYVADEHRYKKKFNLV